MSEMEADKFFYVGNAIMVETPSGRQFTVAETDDYYWADRIVHALNFVRQMNEL